MYLTALVVAPGIRYFVFDWTTTTTTTLGDSHVHSLVAAEAMAVGAGILVHSYHRSFLVGRKGAACWRSKMIAAGEEVQAIVALFAKASAIAEGVDRRFEDLKTLP